MAPPRPRDRGDFEIALICALQVEADAVHAVFDEFLDDKEGRFGQAPGDDNAYTTGVIGGHNVVLAYMPGMGKVSAAAVSVGLRSSFPSIKLALVVGVCGGVPYNPMTRTRIHLGDLIISTALIQYDFGNQFPDDHKKKDTLEDTLGRASPKIRAFLNKLATKHYRRNLQQDISATLEKVGQDDPDMSCPGFDKDLLYQPDYVHQHHSNSPGGACSTCNLKSGMICAAALELSCGDLGCKATMLDQSHNSSTSRPGRSPVLHFGRIGSGDTVLKSGLYRNSLAQRDLVIGFEMAGAGIWDQLPSIVIKSVCDYADSHKNKDWQNYAAAVAAAGVKAFLVQWNPSDHLLANERLDSESGLALYSRMNRQHSVSSDDESSSFKPSRHGVQNLPSGKRRRLNQLGFDSDDRTDNAIQTSLSFPGMLERRSNIERQHRKTCNWILDLEEYLSWQSQQSGLLWIKGKPGAGKSTLMLYLYNTICHERTVNGGVHLDFFFSARGNELQRVPLGMLRSLLNQLFCQDYRIRDVVRKCYQEKEMTFGGAIHSWEWQRRELEALLINAVMLSAQQQLVTIFIDALDEAGGRAARETAQYFHDMNERVSEVSGRLKICISCRHYPIVSRVRGIEVCVEEHNHADIRAFVYDRLHINDNSSRDSSLTDSWHLLADELVQKAQGVFQWVYLVLPMIEESHEDGESLRACRQRLAKVPKELEDVYQHIIQNVINKEDRDRSFQLFQWVCLAERPLSLSEMRHAMACKDIVVAAAKVRCCDTTGYVKEDELMERQIRALSGGLVETVQTEAAFQGDERSTRVQVIHQSVNDFLLSQGLAILYAYRTNTSAAAPVSSILLSVPDVVRLCQANLYYYCLKYLLTEDIGAAVQYDEQLEDAYALRTEGQSSPESPLIVYATLNLFVHAERSVGQRTKPIEDEIRLLDQVVDRWTVLYRTFDKDRDWMRWPNDDTNVLHAAAAANLTEVVKHLLLSNINVDAQDQEGYTAVHLAAQNGHLAVVRLLFDAGCNLDQSTTEGQTPLVLAAGQGHLELVEWLLKHDASIETSESGSDNALRAAAASEAVMVVRYLLNAGANVNAQGGEYGTALQAASAYSNEETIQLLLEAGADVNAQGGEYGTALQAASYCGNEKTVQLLLEAGADVNAQGGYFGSALQAASCQGSEEIVQLLLEAGADVNAQGGYFGSALQAASYCGNEKILQLLLEAGANINTQGGHFGSVLQAASYWGRENVVQLLLEAGADIHIQVPFKPSDKNVTFESALHAASTMGHKEVVQLLLNAGAK